MALPLGRGASMPSLDDCPQTAPPIPSGAAGLPRNRWLVCVGITGWLQSGWPAALRWKGHPRGRGSFQRAIMLEGPLNDEQRARLLRGADTCPVGRTLGLSAEIHTHSGDETH